MEKVFAYSTQLLIVVGVCWVLAVVGVACDVCVARRWRALWWVPVTMIFGPLAAALFVFLWGRQERALAHINRRLIAGQPEPRTQSPPKAEGYADLPTLAVGSGLFLLVRQGAMQDAYRSRQLPTLRPLIIRRANSAEERGGPGELLLHDRAVSRMQHCRLQWAGDRVVLEDTSTNGTFVDDLQIVHTSATVRVGSTIQIGTTELLLCDERQVFPTAMNL